MKKLAFIFAAVAALSLSSCGNPANRTTGAEGSVSISIIGSDTCLPLTQRFAEAFINLHSDAFISVAGGGTGVGLSSLQSGITDIAMASRQIRIDERIRLQESGNEVEEFVIAYDALAVVVHPSNPVTQLTRQQLEDIFTGRTTNWSEVGGNDMQIVVFSRETSSGTHVFFREKVLDRRNFAASALSLPATGAKVQSISQTRGGIGYVGIAYLAPNIQALAVSFDNENFVLPTVENAIDGTYPITRPLFFYFPIASRERLSPFLDFIYSEAGRQVALNQGYVPAIR